MKSEPRTGLLGALDYAGALVLVCAIGIVVSGLLAIFTGVRATGAVVAIALVAWVLGGSEATPYATLIRGHGPGTYGIARAARSASIQPLSISESMCLSSGGNTQRTQELSSLRHQARVDPPAAAHGRHEGYALRRACSPAFRRVREHPGVRRFSPSARTRSRPRGWRRHHARRCHTSSGASGCRHRRAHGTAGVG